ncbi:uncharacterized protein KQ657_001694 [Scheffersomyces spartinae]|uniref:Uncharacterized protein n=1 Tax=Scheffersomyces spartinae TaxID=45513 RepID=A0A9P7V737_9ASCO|nr:uncharacterized protein KQ657_001694 [Scheffersomyces spartinae]KAG7192594.1 hypothetical protein KQ657_001694 [Scheffersomyces spartinae]
MAIRLSRIPLSQRPGTYRVTVHDICQLRPRRNLYKTPPRDASSSYEAWIEKSSSGTRNSPAPATAPESHLHLASLTLASAFLFMKRLPKVRYHIPKEIEIDDLNGELTQNVLRFASVGDYSLISTLLTKALEEKNLIVHPDIITQLFDKFTSNEPVRYCLPLEEEIEVPLYTHSPNASSPYYDYIYIRIPHLFDICKLYENFMFESQVFQDNYARFCYHLDNSEVMQQLIYVYLNNNKIYTPKTLCYFLATSIRTFDIEYAKTLYETLISRGKGLQSEVLNTVIYNLIKAGSIFENLGYVFSIWIANSSKCQLPDAKTMALLLQQYYKFGQEDEVKLMMDMVESIGVSDHFLIQAVSLQAKISLREPGRFRKTVTKEDLVEFDEICRSTEDDKESLRALHYSFLEYFSIRLDMKVIQFLLMSMKRYNITLDDTFYRIISDYYSQRGKFSPHFALLKKAAESGLPYDDIFVQHLFASFVRAYPYMAYDFSTNFHAWLDRSELSGDSKAKIQKHTKIQLLESQLCPYNLARNKLKSKKYSASWASIEWKRTHSKRKFKSYKDQIDFRMNEGLKELINKGVRPEASVLLTTFKRLNQKFRVDILEILKGFRMYLTADSFDIYNYQLPDSTAKLKQYFEVGHQLRLNSRNLLTLCRICLNNKLYDEARTLLLLVKPEELDDRSYMVRLTLELSLAVRERDFSSVINVINAFPVNEVILSPYIAKQCGYVERRISRLIEKHKCKLLHLSTTTPEENTNDGSKNVQQDLVDWEMAAKAHARINGLLGDIDARLAQDALDVHEEVTSMMSFLDNWISSTSK